MQFGLMTEPQFGMTYDTLLGLAAWTEDFGLDAFARSDHYSFGAIDGPHATDAFATLGGLARDTRRIDLTVLVSPITFRHPAVIAKMAATIDEMSGGRLRLGVGAGWMVKEHTAFGLDFYDRSERFARLEEALGYLHHAFGRRPGPFHGSRYRLEETEVRPLPTGPLPIIVGGQGPHRTPKLAGEYADEFNFLPMATDEMRLRVERARAAAEATGRDPASLMISVMAIAVAGADEAEYREILGRVAAADPFGRSAETIDAEYREQGVLVGSRDEVQSRLAEWEAIGVSRVYVQHFGPYETDLLETIFGALGR